MRIHQPASLLIAAFLIFAISLSGCGVISRQAEKLATREQSTLPREMKSADEDVDILKESSGVVQVNDDSSTFVIGKDQIPKDRIGEKIQALLENKTPDKRIVYIKSAVDVHYSTIVSLLDIIRKADIDRVGFVVLRKGDEANARPARFQVQLASESLVSRPEKVETLIKPAGSRPAVKQSRPEVNKVDRSVRPDPLMLVVAIDPSLKITINNESVGNVNETDPLIFKLRDIFKERENNGVFREGTNEVEKTVWIKAPRSLRYGDVVKLIDAVKSAGSWPIFLQIDDLSD